MESWRVLMDVTLERCDQLTATITKNKRGYIVSFGIGQKRKKDLW